MYNTINRFDDQHMGPDAADVEVQNITIPVGRKKLNVDSVSEINSVDLEQLGKGRENWAHGTKRGEKKSYRKMKTLVCGREPIEKYVDVFWKKKIVFK